MKGELNEKDTPTSGPGRSRQSNSKDTHENHPSGNQEPENHYGRAMKLFAEQEKADRERISSEDLSTQDVLDDIKRDFLKGIKMIHPFYFLAFLLCLILEYFVWEIHFEQWYAAHKFEPSFMILSALKAFGTVASMAVLWHCVIHCSQNKHRTGRIGRLSLTLAFVAIVIFGCLFAFESMTFYEFMRLPKPGPMGEMEPGKSHWAALTTIGSWGGVNFITGLITGFCTSHIIRKG